MPQTSQSSWTYRDEELFCEDTSLTRIAASHGTPAYVYSKAAIARNFHAYEDALADVPHRVCYAVKANSNIAILNLLAAQGAGFDIVSGGELYRVLAAGGDPHSVVFSGVGKTAAEIRFALSKGIHSFNCESEYEVGQISRAAVALNTTASIAIRVNPDVNAATHPYISTGLRSHKFGIDIEAAAELYRRAAALPGIAVEGVSCHIGSQILDTNPLLEAADRVLAFIERLRGEGLTIRTLDLGGGAGAAYRSGEQGAHITEFLERLKEKIQGRDLVLMLEPGRSIVANAGVLLTRVLHVKENAGKRFVIVDAAMNDLLRPALYQAYHEITPVERPRDETRCQADVVGPVCESGDFFAHNRELPLLKPGDLLAIETAGAYGFALASNYNARPRACELLVDGADVQTIRRRETYEDLIRGESIPTVQTFVPEI